MVTARRKEYPQGKEGVVSLVVIVAKYISVRIYIVSQFILILVLVIAAKVVIAAVILTSVLYHLAVTSLVFIPD